MATPADTCADARHHHQRRKTMGTRILIADDNPMVCAMLSQTLHSEGYMVDVASDGVILLAKAQSLVPDLLVIDLLMPRMDGHEAIRQIRNDTRLAHIPIIVLSARDTTDDVVSSFANGADDYVVKPYNPSEFLARVQAQLQRANRRPVLSPLTGLPGNTLIAEEINHRLQEQMAFALLYIDLDSFKAFNDTFGFAHGDRVIQLLATLLIELRTSQRFAELFLGHIGGDDFVAIVAPNHAVPFAEALMHLFAQRLPTLEGIDFSAAPMQTISTGMVFSESITNPSYATISRMAAKMKQIAKQNPGSGYVIEGHYTRIYDAPVQGANTLLFQSNGSLGAERLRTLMQRYGWRVIDTATIAPTLIVVADQAPAALSQAAQEQWPQASLIEITLLGDQMARLRYDTPIGPAASTELFRRLLHLNRLEEQ